MSTVNKTKFSPYKKLAKFLALAVVTTLISSLVVIDVSMFASIFSYNLTMIVILMIPMASWLFVVSETVTILFNKLLDISQPDQSTTADDLGTVNESLFFTIHKL